MSTCLDSLHNLDRVVKSSIPSQSRELTSRDCNGKLATSIELERTAGGLAVSGVYGREPAGSEGPAGIPWTNSKPLLNSGGFFIKQPGPPEGSPDPGGGSWSGPAASYKDYYANPATSKKPACGKWAVVAECSSGESHFAKKLYCGKEWCPVCGEDNSAAHKRRQARLLPKVQQMSQLGYFVIEWPEVYRYIGEWGFNPDPEDAVGWCYNKKDLRGTTTAIVGVLAGKRMGRRGRVGGYFKRGIPRWHWFGDKLPGKWNPHLNVFVDGGHLEPELLETIKAELRAALNVPDLIVHYSYCDTPGQMVQKVRYLTRATFRNYDWNPYMANELWGFRNIRWWGNWKAEPVWELKQAEAQGEDIAGLEVVSKLQDGLCPDCGLPLKVIGHNHKTGKPVIWSRPVDSTYLIIWQAEEIAGTGYYRIPHNGWGGYDFSPGELLKLSEMEHKHRLKVRAALAKINRPGRDEVDRALWNEVLSPVKNFCQYRGSRADSLARDKTVRKPNCLGSPPVVGKN